jgi:hypothetical protein
MGSDAVEELNILAINQDEETLHTDKVHIASKTSLPHYPYTWSPSYLRLPFEKETNFPCICIDVLY